MKTVSKVSIFGRAKNVAKYSRPHVYRFHLLQKLWSFLFHLFTLKRQSCNSAFERVFESHNLGEKTLQTSLS